jgi:GTPase
MSFLSGFIAIIGPPNAGKSTLLNKLIGRKIAITSPRPQTTRNRVLGICNGDDYQMIFMDTPGIHKTKSVLHKSMVTSAETTLLEVDIVLLVVSLSEDIQSDSMKIISRHLKNLDKPILLAVNKIDIKKKEALLPIIEAYDKLNFFESIIPVSALYGDGLDALKKVLIGKLSPGPQFFPNDITTDKSEEFLISEIIREKIFFETRQELPYSSTVLVEKIEENREQNMVFISALIIVEKTTQKGMIIGRQGKMLKKIGEKARIDIERLFSCKVYLKLFVKVEKNWSSNTRSLRKLGY